MLVNSRMVAFALSFVIALVTVAFVSLVEDTPVSAVVIAGIFSFTSASLLIYITLEFLIFKEINSLYDRFDKIRKKDFDFLKIEPGKLSSNPLKRVNQELLVYAGQKQKEIDELRKMESFRREFIADISHELKTPIFAAQGFILTLMDGAVNDENVRDKFLKKSAKSLDALSALVKDLITLTSIESGDLPMNFKDFDIAELSQDVFEQLENEADKKKIRFHLAAVSDNEEEPALLVHGDPQRIRQVLTNLVMNAIKYGEENGNIWVEIKDQHSTIKTQVKDDGPGIPEQDLGRIFERFYRVEKSRSKKKGGSGLGLAIAKHIMEKHSSKIKVKSTVDKGTTFSFKLKKSAVDAKRPTEAPVI